MDTPLIIALIIIAIGFFGALIPVVPGVPLVFGGILVYAVLTGFREIGLLLLAIFLILTVFAVAVDWLATAIGARRFGASGWGIVGALVGLVIGLILLPPFGAIIGPVAGAILFELARGRTTRESVRSGAGALVGYLVSVVFELGVAVVMTGIFLARVLL
jgi:uncharacterized protein YqgC (DUF456 family)